jgi:hypothetical protein
MRQYTQQSLTCFLYVTEHQIVLCTRTMTSMLRFKFQKMEACTFAQELLYQQSVTDCYWDKQRKLLVHEECLVVMLMNKAYAI